MSKKCKLKKIVCAVAAFCVALSAVPAFGAEAEIAVPEADPAKTAEIPAAGPFTDVPEGTYFRDAVMWAYETGVTSGTSDTEFSPQATCTRGQVVTFLWRAAGKPEAAAGADSQAISNEATAAGIDSVLTSNEAAATDSAIAFEDVRPEDYFAKAVLWVVEQGITTGTSKTTFSPNDLCQNAQVITFLWRANGSPEPSIDSEIVAGRESEYYAKALSWADEKELLAGMKEGFQPGANSPRSDIVTYLYRNSGDKITRFDKGSLRTSQVADFSYLLYKPAGARAGMPLIVYLHDDGLKGADLDEFTEKEGLPKFINDGMLGNVPAFVLIPQLPSEVKEWGAVAESLKELINSVASQFSADKTRISLTGCGFGGNGAYELAVKYPELFCCICPLSGSIKNTEENIAALAKIPVMGFAASGEKENTKAAKDLFAALKKAGSFAGLNVLTAKDKGELEKAVYLDKDIALFSWMIMPEEDNL